MKYLVAIALLLLGSVMGQQPTGNPVADVQIYAEAIHQMYEGTFDNVRYYVTSILRVQNDALLQIALDEMNAWNADGRKTADEQVSDNLGPRNTQAMGETFRSCLQETSETLNERVIAIFEEIERGRAISTHLQTIANFGLVDFNLFQYYFNYYDYMSSRIYAYYNTLIFVSIPSVIITLICPFTNLSHLSLFCRAQEIDPKLENLVGELEYNQELMEIKLEGCLSYVRTQHGH